MAGCWRTPATNATSITTSGALTNELRSCECLSILPLWCCPIHHKCANQPLVWERVWVCDGRARYSHRHFCGGHVGVVATSPLERCALIHFRHHHSLNYGGRTCVVVICCIRQPQ